MHICLSPRDSLWVGTHVIPNPENLSSHKHLWLGPLLCGRERKQPNLSISLPQRTLASSACGAVAMPAYSEQNSLAGFPGCLVVLGLHIGSVSHHTLRVPLSLMLQLTGQIGSLNGQLGWVSAWPRAWIIREWSHALQGKIMSVSEGFSPNSSLLHRV